MAGVRFAGPPTSSVLQRRAEGRAELWILTTASVAELASARVAVTDASGAAVDAPAAVRAAADSPLVTLDGDSPLPSAQSALAVSLDTGGPYTVRVELGDGESWGVDDILVGEVWVLAGQSNMQGAEEAAPDGPAVPQVRVLSIAGRWEPASEPLHRLWEDRDCVQLHVHTVMYPDVDLDAEFERRRGTAAQHGGGVGPGLPFAAAMVAATGVPIGLLPCALGSTGLGMWTRDWARSQGYADSTHSLFWNLVRRVRHAGGATGMLWYQGEGDTGAGLAETYAARFLDFVGDVRTEIAAPRLPVIAVQIGGIDPADPLTATLLTDDGPQLWERVREEIRRLPSLDADIDVVAAADLPRCDLIHLSAEGQRRLGGRLARAALARRGSSASIPAVVAVERCEDPHRVRVQTRGTWAARSLNGPAAAAFELRSPDADAATPHSVAIDGADLVLTFRRPVTAGATLVHGVGLIPSLFVDEAADVALPAFGPLIVSSVDEPCPA